MPNIFISYARRDFHTARRLRARLQAEGIVDIFLDVDPVEGLKPGSFWARELETKVRASKVLLGLVGGALQTLVTCLAASLLADRNAATYGRMTQVLDALSGEPLEGARVAAANGDQLTLERFWTKLSFELIGEQREWSAALKTAQLLTLDKLADVPFANND